MTTDTLKPEELRIGNWVNESIVDLENGSWKLNPIQVDGNRIKCIELGDVARGIPLTPEILERCGFEWDIFYQGLSNGRYVINILNDNTISFSYGKRRHDEMQFLPYIKYLHQLQNLYYALTQTELQIQL